MNTEPLTCKELVELVTDYLEDALPATDRLRFEEHIETCDGCVRYLSQIRQTIQLTGKLREEQLDPTSKQALLKTFRNWKRV